MTFTNSQSLEAAMNQHTHILDGSTVSGTNQLSKHIRILTSISQWSDQVFKRAGHQFSKRAFSAQCSMIKKALTTVISTFYQHFDDYFCDGHLFDSSLFICLTIGYKLMPDCFFFVFLFFLFGSLKRAGC